MGTSSRKLLETAAACAEQQLAAFTPAQLAKVAWSLAKLRWPAPRVLRHAGAQLAERTAAFNDKEASNVLWALASEVRGAGLADAGGVGGGGMLQTPGQAGEPAGTEDAWLPVAPGRSQLPGVSQLAGRHACRARRCPGRLWIASPPTWRRG